MSKRVAYCEEHGHFPEQVIGSVPMPEEEAKEQGLSPPHLQRFAVWQDAEGRSTDVWSDGTRGVPEFVRDLCEMDEEPECGDHPGCLCSWRDTH